MDLAAKLEFIVSDDHSLVRQGVRMVLEAEFTDSRVIEAADFDTTLTAVAAHPGAMLLIDLDMPGMDGAESLRALRQDFPYLRMAVLSGNAERAMIINALNAGVNGYILKANSAEELLHAVSTVLGGRLYLADVFSKMLGVGEAIALRSTAPPPAPEVEATSTPTGEMPPLTPRQRQVMEWLMKGHSNKQIARDLDIGEGTVKIHMAAIFRVLGVQNRTEAVMAAAQRGLRL